MDITPQHGIDLIRAFYVRYYPENPMIKEVAVEVFEGMSAFQSLEQAFQSSIIQSALFAGTADGFERPELAGPENADALVVLNHANVTDVVNFIYRGAMAADKASVISAIEGGTLTNSEFVVAYSLIGLSSDQPPSPLAILSKAFDDAAVQPVLPQADLSFAGVTQAQEKLLVSLYIGAFDRAPEHQGLAFWASELAAKLSSGASMDDAYLAVSKAMYQAGAANGEGSTGLANADYVNAAYTSALGRAPDAAGKAFWVEQLDKGAIERGEFLATFLQAAGGSVRDDNYLQARVAVAEHAAQAHVSGSGAASIDLHAVLANVTDAASALIAIQGIEAGASHNNGATTPGYSSILEASLAQPIESITTGINTAQFGSSAAIINSVTTVSGGDTATVITLSGVSSADLSVSNAVVSHFA